MSSLFHQVLTLVLLYGYPVIGLAEFGSSVGLPIPMTAVLLLAGSLAALGSLSFPTLLLLVVLCGVGGDLFDYWLGRSFGYPALGKLSRGRIGEGAASGIWQRYLSRWATAGVFLTRWLFTPACAAVSLLAGVGRLPLRQFLAAAAAGEALGALLYLGAGYLVGTHWPEIWSDLSGVPGIATAIAAGLLLMSAGVVRLLRHHQADASQAIAEAPVSSSRTAPPGR